MAGTFQWSDGHRESVLALKKVPRGRGKDQLGVRMATQVLAPTVPLNCCVTIGMLLSFLGFISSSEKWVLLNELISELRPPGFRSS